MVTLPRETRPVGLSVTATSTAAAAKNSTPITGATLSVLSHVNSSTISERGPAAVKPPLRVAIDAHHRHDESLTMTIRVESRVSPPIKTSGAPDMLYPAAGCSNVSTCGYSKRIISGGKFKTAVETPGGTMAAPSDRGPGHSAVSRKCRSW